MTHISKVKKVVSAVKVGSLCLGMIAVLLLSFSRYALGSDVGASPVRTFRPHDALGQYLLTACKTSQNNRGNQRTLRIQGQAQASGRSFLEPIEGFGGHIRSNGDIEIEGKGSVNGNAMPGPNHVVRIRGNGVVSGSTKPATEILDCSIENLGSLILGVKQQHQNDQIP
ncbi:MAG: hypothetical protein HY731_13000, partial [Candidatus Tectomicrobia bacterium]|nr:hypothetical protein [Candidatus Tectomicrobia bacterium]